MRLLAYLTEGFINTFGITKPTPEQEPVVNLVIGGFLLAFCVVVLSVIGFLLYRVGTIPAH